MSPLPTKVIIDTDPGIDDVLAMLLALSASAEELEVLLISVTFGNVGVQSCLRNVVALFHVIEKELEWRRSNGRPLGFQCLRACRPLVAAGADGPLDDQLLMADYFHGVDGLAGVHSSHQHLSPPETWKTLFSTPPSSDIATTTIAAQAEIDTNPNTRLFIPSQRPSHLEIIRILDENPPDTVTIVAVGPLTNIALAASHSPQSLMRAKAILVMGGAVDFPGNMTPLAEFNTYADTVAAARVFALTSPDPASTMPPSPPPSDSPNTKSATPLPPYPLTNDLGARRLNLILFPLDITTQHFLHKSDVISKVSPQCKNGSPLAEWVEAFLTPTFTKMGSLYSEDSGLEGTGSVMSLHDPMCVWYAIEGEPQRDKWIIKQGEDIRVETAGQWTRGACVIDKRGRQKLTAEEEEQGLSGDTDSWCSLSKGNRLGRCVGTPGEEVLGKYLLDVVFGTN